MPGSPQGQRQTDNPTRDITFKGEEYSKAEGNPERESEGKGSIPLFSISWWLSVLQSQDFLSWFSFFLLFVSLFYRVPTQFLGQFMVSVLDTKRKH